MTLRVSASDEIMYNSVSAFLFHEQLQDGFWIALVSTANQEAQNQLRSDHYLLSPSKCYQSVFSTHPSVLHDASCSWIHQVQLFVALCSSAHAVRIWKAKGHTRSSLLFHIHHHSTNSTKVVDLLLFSLNLWLTLKQLTKSGTKSLLKHTP